MDNLAERIRKLAEVIEPEHIATSLKIPLEVVRGILNGEIPDDVLKNYDPSRPPEVRVVEKKRYVRSRIVGVFGPGGTGVTTVAGLLAYLLAGRGITVCAVDFSEYAALGPYLGIDCWQEKAVRYPNVLWPVKNPADLTVQTEVSNLYVIPGAATLGKHKEIDWERAAGWLKEVSAVHETVILDLPRDLDKGKPLMDTADRLVMVLRGDLPGVNVLWQAKPVIQNYLPKTHVLFNKGEKAVLNDFLKELLEYTAGYSHMPGDRLEFDVFKDSKTEFARFIRKKILPFLGYEDEQEPKKGFFSMFRPQSKRSGDWCRKTQCGCSR